MLIENNEPNHGFIWMMIKSLPSFFDGRFFKCWWDKRIHFKMNTLDCFFLNCYWIVCQKDIEIFHHFLSWFCLNIRIWILNGIFWTIKLNSNTWLGLSVIQECDFKNQSILKWYSLILREKNILLWNSSKEKLSFNFTTFDTVRVLKLGKAWLWLTYGLNNFFTYQVLLCIFLICRANEFPQMTLQLKLENVWLPVYGLLLLCSILKCIAQV